MTELSFGDSKVLFQVETRKTSPSNDGNLLLTQLTQAKSIEVHYTCDANANLVALSRNQSYEVGITITNLLGNARIE